MKLYRARNTTDALYYEKQADVPRGTKFEAVEFPFSASPKADFVDWMNGFSSMAEAAPQEPTIPAQTVEVARDNPLQFDDAWEQFSIARKLHFAALACEDARSAIK